MSRNINLIVTRFFGRSYQKIRDINHLPAIIININCLPIPTIILNSSGSQEMWNTGCRRLKTDTRWTDQKLRRARILIFYKIMERFQNLIFLRIYWRENKNGVISTIAKQIEEAPTHKTANPDPPEPEKIAGILNHSLRALRNLFAVSMSYISRIVRKKPCRSKTFPNTKIEMSAKKKQQKEIIIIP